MAVILPILLGLVLFAVISSLVRAPGQNLRTKFVKLGQLKGKTKAEIVAIVGPPIFFFRPLRAERRYANGWLPATISRYCLTEKCVKALPTNSQAKPRVQLWPQNRFIRSWVSRSNRFRLRNCETSLNVALLHLIPW